MRIKNKTIIRLKNTIKLYVLCAFKILLKKIAVINTSTLIVILVLEKCTILPHELHLIFPYINFLNEEIVFSLQ